MNWKYYQCCGGGSTRCCCSANTAVAPENVAKVGGNSLGSNRKQEPWITAGQLGMDQGLVSFIGALIPNDSRCSLIPSCLTCNIAIVVEDDERNLILLFLLNTLLKIKYHFC